MASLVAVEDSDNSGEVEDRNTSENPFANLKCEQRFEDTSLNNLNSGALLALMKKETIELGDLGDLVLWNILRYAHDAENFFVILRVSKEWKKIALSISPQPITRIRFVMRNHSLELLDWNPELLQSIYDWCYRTNSALYRFSGNRVAAGTEDSCETIKSWPCLQPQFMIEMFSYIYSLCTQRTPYNFSANIYEHVINSCMQKSTSSVKKMQESFLNGQSIQSNASTPLLLVNKFNARMDYLINYFYTINDVFGYLNRYYVQHHSTPTIIKGAIKTLIVALVTCEDGMRQLTSLITPDLLKDCTSEEKLTFSTFSKLVAHLTAKEYEIAGELMLERDKKDQLSFVDKTKRGKIYVETKEGEIIECFEEELKEIGLIRLLLLREGDKIGLPTVSLMVFRKVIEFCKYHHENGPMNNIEKPLRSPNLADITSEWDAAYIAMNQEMLFELIQAANYLDIPSLLDLACAKVAAMIKGKTPEEIRTTFNIVNDFTPEEEAHVREENAWCEEA